MTTTLSTANPTDWSAIEDETGALSIAAEPTPAPTAPALQAPTVTPRPARCSGDRGEGVISAAIAVLIIAFLGVMMWAGFTRIWTDIEERTTDQIANIGAEAGPEE